VAPIVEANDTTTVPVTRPNNAPPARVITGTAGRARAKTTT
jgi:hypothetical protein